MSRASTPDAVFVEAAARLHFGVLDLRGGLGRWFGGIGTAAPGPTLLISVSRAERLEATGDEADRAAGFARKVLAHHGIHGGARVEVRRALPAHAGLGSGTQLALAVARGLAELHGLGTDAHQLARIVGRGDRSAIGTHAFAAGGLVVEGGRRPGADGIAPLIARLPFPPEWRCVVAVPHPGRGISGSAEAAAFDALSPPPDSEVARVAHLVLMGLLPALAEADLEAFGEALTEIQAATGRWFAPVQGGTFAPGPSAELVRSMRTWGARGVGQSSWGPAVYGIVEDDDAGRALARNLRNTLGERGRVYDGPFRTDGARVWRAAVDEVGGGTCRELR